MSELNMKNSMLGKWTRYIFRTKWIPQLLCTGYALLVLYWMFFGFGRTAGNSDDPYRYNLIPFQTVMDFAMMRVGDHWDQLINLLGNIGVFVPFGVLLPWIRPLNVVELMIRFVPSIFVVEILQMLTRRGTFDVDDIILNTLGVCLGYMVWRAVNRYAAGI